MMPFAKLALAARTQCHSEWSLFMWYSQWVDGVRPVTCPNVCRYRCCGRRHRRDLIVFKNSLVTFLVGI
jgi:hypothetical protein